MILGSIDTEDTIKILEILKHLTIPVNTYNPNPNRNMARAKSFGTHRACILGYIRKRTDKLNTPKSL